MSRQACHPALPDQWSQQLAASRYVVGSLIRIPAPMRWGVQRRAEPSTASRRLRGALLKQIAYGNAMAPD